MYSLKGYIDGNTVVALDDNLRDFTGTELLIQIVEKPKASVTTQTSQTSGSERLKALHSLQGILKGAKPTTISEIREERLKERYGL